MSSDPARPAPIGVLPRAALLLRLLADAGDSGLRLQDLVPRSGLAQPTVHRLLTDLSELGVVARPDGRRYALGPALEELALDRPTPAPIARLSETRAILQGLADELGDTVYLAARMYRSAQYLLRCDGDSPIRVFSVHEGEVKPLATSYAGIALLAGLGAEQRQPAIDEALAAIPDRWEPRDPAVLADRLSTLIAQVHRTGWCGGLPVVPNVAGVACPVPRASGAPVLAVTVSAASSRMPEERIPEVAERLL
ncbi:IclR family transcriptional regulator, partial [Leucobacter sp. M11]|uniref:IclR family transcriptional regulator n=1 Tax=Leucobacter sp. M11 TaxID=2993565 RepID=UPI002D8070B0